MAWNYLQTKRVISYTKTQLIGWRVRGFLKLTFMSHQISNILARIYRTIVFNVQTTLFQYFKPFSTNNLNGMKLPANKKSDILYQNPINWVESERVFKVNFYELSDIKHNITSKRSDIKNKTSFCFEFFTRVFNPIACFWP